MNSRESFDQSIFISNQAISRIALHSALECYGVVGLVYPSLKSTFSNIINLGKQPKGIKVTRKNGSISIDMFVVIEYGTNLNEVAKNLSEVVKFEIEKYTELQVKQVEIHVQRLKVHK